MGKFVAVEIGSKITKIIHGQYKKDDLVIKDYRLIENTDKIYTPDGDLNINEVHPILKTILKELKIRRTDCYLTVGGQSGIVRLREMPLVKIKEMKEIVRFEAEQFLPYDIEGFYVDYRVNQIKADQEEENLNVSKQNEVESVAEVMIIATPKEKVDEQVTLVDKLKLNIKRVDYYTDAIYSYFKKYILQDDKNTLVVDLGSKGMKLTMFNGKTYFANIFSELGLIDLFERYSEFSNVTNEEAEKLLINRKNDNKKEVDKIESIHSKLEKLREKMQLNKVKTHNQNTVNYEIEPKLERLYEPIGYEVSKMMEFFKTRQFGMSVDEIYLIGGGSNMKQFDEFLHLYHNIPVRKVNKFAHDAQISESDYQLLLPAIGGLLKGGC